MTTCRDCERPACAKGYCKRHYLVHWREENREHVRAWDKGYRLRRSDETEKRKAEYRRAWNAAHPENRRAAYLRFRDRHRAFPVGSEAWVYWCGHWCRGAVVRIARGGTWVRLVGGTVVHTAQRQLEREAPEVV